MSAVVVDGATFEIETHIANSRGYYAVSVDGEYLCGPNGRPSRFPSRKDAKAYAIRTIQASVDDRKRSESK